MVLILIWLCITAIQSYKSILSWDDGIKQKSVIMFGNMMMMLESAGRTMASKKKMQDTI